MHKAQCIPPANILYIYSVSSKRETMLGIITKHTCSSHIFMNLLWKVRIFVVI